ncbi:hypothetical protein BH11CYA1_BH11CYA1_07340 [soil metagenome]
MFTQQTISALSSLHELVYKSSDLLLQTSQPHRSKVRDVLLSEVTSTQLAATATIMHKLNLSALQEGLTAAQPQFVGTPFEQNVSEIAAGYLDGSPSAVLSASVALASLERKASVWLKVEAEACLPLQKYTVDSAFGPFTVDAKSPEKARLVAAAQHHKCAVEDLAGDELRGFTNGVLVF